MWRAVAAWFLTASCVAFADEAPPEPNHPIGMACLDLQGEIHRLGDADGARAVALVFLSPECPIARGYLPELGRIAGEFAGRVEFYGVIVDPVRTRASLAKDYGDGVGFPLIFDSAGLLTAICKPTHVPEAFVYWPDGRLAYRGRIDDQYAEVRKRRTNVSERNLFDALSALCEGRDPSVQAREPVGCPIPKVETNEISYARHVAPLLFANCVQCHRPGEVAPFSLLTHDDAAKRADWLAEITGKHVMPPWHARSHGEFRGERKLRASEISLLARWAEKGAPRGDEADLPIAPKFSDGWQLGEPDLVLRMDEAFEIPADGPDAFRFFVLPIPIDEDQTVAAVEFRPGNPLVVHHAILYLDASGMARKRDAADPLPGYEGFLTGGFRPSGTLGFWAPGYTPRYLPSGVGQLLKAGSDLAMQLHYHPSGKPESDRSQVGIYFAKAPVTKQISGFAMIDFDVDIPPGAERHKMEHSFTTPVDLQVLDVTPHMHMIGTEMKLTVTPPGGEPKPLVWTDWDFNWQEQYLFREPAKIPAGSRLDLEAWFDNSSANPYNPNQPPARVRFGEMTTDEMCICALRLISDDDASRKKLKQAQRAAMQQQLANPKIMASILDFLKRGTPEGEPLDVRGLLGSGAE